MNPNGGSYCQDQKSSMSRLGNDQSKRQPDRKDA